METSGQAATYRDSNSTISNPRTLRISHQNANSATGTDRHLVQFSRTDDDANEVPYTGTVHAVFALPREGVTSANLKLEWEKLKNLIDASIDEIIGGFMPSDGGGV
jgi:hypothetical protein